MAGRIEESWQSKVKKYLNAISGFFPHELGTTIAGSIDSSLKGLFGIFVLEFFLQKENHACSANFVFCFWKKDVVVR